MEYADKKKKNRYRDRKKTEFTFGKGIRKKRAEKVIIPKDSIT